MKLAARQLTLFPAFASATKNCPRCLKDFIDYTSYGRAHLCPDCKKPVVTRPKWRELKELAGRPLTLRESQIAELILEGKLNKEIAWACKLSEGTVKVYASQMFAKAGVRGRVEFTLWWLKKTNRLVA